jgi:dihydrofolate reductase
MAASLDGFIARKDGCVDWLETSDEFADGHTLDPEFVETFLKTIDCYVMGSRTYETALSFEAKGFGWAYGDKPTFVLTSRDLPRTRDTVKFHSGDLGQFVNGHLRPVFRNVWFVGGGVVCGECLRLGLADEVRYSILPVLMAREYSSLRNLTETSCFIWRRSRPIRAAWWSFVTRCEDIMTSHRSPPNFHRADAP